MISQVVIFLQGALWEEYFVHFSQTYNCYLFYLGDLSTESFFFPPKDEKCNVGGKRYCMLLDMQYCIQQK